MSVTINIYYKGENGNARKFAEEMEARGIADRVRAQAGNERFEYFYPAANPETVLLIDRWVNREAIDIHHKSAMMKEIAELRVKYKLKMKVEKFCDLQ